MEVKINLHFHLKIKNIENTQSERERSSAVCYFKKLLIDIPISLVWDESRNMVLDICTSADEQ